MSNHPDNEPVLGYAPGSSERGALQVELDRQMNEVVEIPCIINGEKVEGAVLTSMAFADAIPWFPVVLTIAIILFAISTMISWSYYGLQSWMFVFGKSKISDLSYKILFLIFIVIGAAGDMSSVWAFSDAMILALVFPNMIGLLLLFPKVRDELSNYLSAIGVGSSSK